MIFGVARFDPQCLLKMALCRFELSLRRQQRSKINVCLRRAWIQTDHLSKFLRCFIGSPGLLQFGSIVHMGSRARRQICNNRAQAFQFSPAAFYFGEPEYPERNYKNRDPLCAVQSPTGEKTT